VRTPGLVRAAAVALALTPVGCRGGMVPPDRPQPIAYADTLPIREPANREASEVARLIPTAVSGEVSDVLGLRSLTGRKREALNVGRFDDVPNSAWFEHRNRGRTMSPEQVRVGPTTSAGPAPGPLTIVAAKVQGVSPGYTVKDSRGDRYVLKFDPVGFLYLSSGAGVISNRLLYAAGYHVPEDYIFRFTTDRLQVDPEATVSGDDFIERPLTLQVARDALSRTDSLPDGSYVAVASKFVPGPPKGPFYFEGTRGDDPNDHYRHEHRRELRGLSVVSAWINHVDMRFMNTLDAFVPPGYLRHYLIDFAATLGSGTLRPHEPREGLEYNFDFWDVMARLFTLGFYRVGWEAIESEPIHPTIGWLSGDSFDPEKWKANWPNAAFNNMTARDAYWGAKLVGAFDEARIRAAVAAGGLPDAEAAEALTRILLTRRAKIVEHWYAKVSPVENPVVVRAAGGFPVLRFEDLGITDGPWNGEGTRYGWSFEDPATGERAAGSDVSEREGNTVDIVLPGSGSDVSRNNVAYSTVDIVIVRDGAEVEPRPARVYLRWTENGYEIAGLEH
jgi:hypothetical protein